MEVWPSPSRLPFPSVGTTGRVTFTEGLLPPIGAAEVAFKEGLIIPFAGATFISNLIPAATLLVHPKVS